MKFSPTRTLIAIIACEAVGITSSFFTVQNIPTWYATLERPWFAPPNWLFGPVWTILYALMGISVALVWEQGIKKPQVKQAVQTFVAQLVANFFWSILFFGLRSPILGLVGVFVLWSLIVLTIKQFYPLSKWAAYLLLPYLAWVSFASLLNLALFILN